MALIELVLIIPLFWIDPSDGVMIWCIPQKLMCCSWMYDSILIVLRYLRSVSFMQFLKSSTETSPKQSLGLIPSWDVSADINKTEKSKKLKKRPRLKVS